DRDRLARRRRACRAGGKGVPKTGRGPGDGHALARPPLANLGLRSAQGVPLPGYRDWCDPSILPERPVRWLILPSALARRVARGAVLAPPPAPGLPALMLPAAATRARSAHSVTHSSSLTRCVSSPTSCPA